MPSYDHFALTEDQISSSLSPFGVHPSSDQILKIREYVRLLLKWNQSLSLTSITDPEEILVRHFGESMFLSALMPVENCRLADLGSGAGFPGLPLKILSPSTQVTLIESNKKKCVFLSEVIRTLDLSNVEVISSRFEDIRVKQNPAEFVISRAVGEFRTILQWAKAALTPRGHVALWVGGTDTIKISRTKDWIWQPAVRIPESQRRFLLIGRPFPKSD